MVDSSENNGAPLPDKGATHRIVAMVIFAVALVSFMPGKFLVSWDLSTYLAAARNVIDGHGFVDPAGQVVNSRLGYIASLAAVIWLAGPSLWAIALFEAVASALVVVGTFVVGRALFGFSTGIIAAALWLSSADWNFWLPRHLDPFWPAALLFALALICSPATKRERWRTCAAAALYLFAFSIKETSVLFLAGIILGQVLGTFPAYRARVWYFVVLSLSGMLLLVMAQTYGHDGPVNPHSGGRLNVVKELIVGHDVFTALRNLVAFGYDGLLRALFGIGGNSRFSEVMPLLPLFIVALPFSIYAALRKSPTERLILILVAVNLPFMALVGQLDFRPSQNLFFVALVYLVIASVVVWCISKIVSGSLLRTGCLVFCVALLAAWQSAGGVLDLKKSKGRNFAWRACCAKANVDAFEARLRGAGVAQWIRSNSEVGDVILVSDPPSQHGVNFLNGMRNRMIFPPLHNLTFAGGWADSPMAPPGRRPYEAAGVWQGLIFPRPVFLLEPTWFSNAIEDSDATIAIVADKGMDPIIEAWLRQRQDLNAIAEIADRKTNYRVYDISDLNQNELATEQPLLVNRGFVEYMKFVKSEHQERWPWYIDELFEQRLGLSGAQAEAIVGGRPAAVLDVVD